MRKILVVMFVISVMILSLTPVPVSAHNLQWGIMPDSTFEFTAHGNRQDIGNVDVDYLLTITALEAIPVTFTYYEDFPRTTISLKDLDSGSLDLSTDISSMCFGSRSAMPIGDWGYLSTVMEAGSEYHDIDWFKEITTFGNTTHWGYSVYGEHPNGRVHKTTIYLRSNGIMVYFTGSRWDYALQVMTEDVTIERFIEPTTTTSTTTTPTTSDTMTSSSTTSDTGGTGTTLAISPELGLVLVLLFGVIGIAVIMKRRKDATVGRTLQSVSPDAKVLIVCPYCGARNEQGVLKCHNCQADV